MKILQSCFPGSRSSDLPSGFFVREVTEHLQLHSEGNISASLAISFDTLFGCFPIRTWRENTSVRRVALKVHFHGKALIIIRMRLRDDTPVELARQVAAENDNFEIWTELPDEAEGVIYPVIVPMSPSFTAIGIEWITSDEFIREPAVAVVIPTYKREQQLKRNAYGLANLAADLPGLHIFVVDNANTLVSAEFREFSDITLVPNRNLGGAGGFAKGVFEAITDGKFTHIVMCDDDADLEPESLRRAVAFFSFAKENIYLGGMMLYQHQRDFIHEAGALVSGPNSFLSRKNGLSAVNPQDLCKLDVKESIDYFGWYLVGFPIAAAREHGLSAPFFIRFDDQEFGLRLLSNGYAPVTLMGFCVWHEAFHLRDNQLTHYYLTRNGLVSMFAHRPDVRPRELLRQIRAAFWTALLTLRYDRANMIVTGLTDCMRGPDFLDIIDAEALNSQLVIRQRNPIRSISSDALGEPFRVRRQRKKRFKRLISRMTLGGHLLPPQLTRRKFGCYINADNIQDAATANRIFYFEPIINLGWVAERNRARFFSLLIKGIPAFTVAYFCINSVARSHRRKLVSISSISNWQRRFKSVMHS